MQMLQTYFGADGARYVVWLLTAFALIILALFVWWLIRKALGDRINMSDRADRRGRPPRLGVTESFTIGPQGRRLVMVRRDNVEHLIMIGGPNDVVIETNVVRGERPVVGRPDTRASDAELIALPDPLPAVKTTTEMKPALAEPRIAEPRPTEQKAALPPLRAPELPAALPPVAATPAELPPVKVPAPAVVPAPPPEPPPVAPAPTPSLAERIKAGFGRNTVAPKPEPPVAEPPKTQPLKPEPPMPTSPAAVSPKPEAFEAMTPKPVDPPKPPAPPAIELPKIDLPKPAAPKVDLPPVPTPAEMKAKLEEAVKAKLQATPPPPPAPLPPAAAKPPAEPPPPVKPAPAAAAKNPFDSLEEEMAKLLGRAPDGKG